MKIKDINNSLLACHVAPFGDAQNNVLPDCYNYFDFYDFEYYAKRFPIGFIDSLPGFDKYILSIAEKKKEEKTTPLKEILKIRSKIE